jgi:hypothetical protein
MQQSVSKNIRQGFPISSEEINDVLDGYLYDLVTILTTNPATVDNTYQLLLNALSDVEGHADHGKYKKDTIVKDGHTPNWRHI